VIQISPEREEHEFTRAAKTLANSIRLDAFDAAAGAASFHAKCGFHEIAHVTYTKDPLVYFELLLAAA
jgi:hypothetical protein